MNMTKQASKVSTVVARAKLVAPVSRKVSPVVAPLGSFETVADLIKATPAPVATIGINAKAFNTLGYDAHAGAEAITNAIMPMLDDETALATAGVAFKNGWAARYYGALNGETLAKAIALHAMPTKQRDANETRFYNNSKSAWGTAILRAHKVRAVANGVGKATTEDTKAQQEKRAATIAAMKAIKFTGATNTETLHMFTATLAQTIKAFVEGSSEDVIKMFRAEMTKASMALDTVASATKPKAKK
jgi:hypothetical protein